MLNFRNANIFFFISLLALAGYDIFYPVHFLLYMALAAAYGLTLFYGCYVIQSNFFLPVHCSAQTNVKEIAISFDDGPANQFTPEILDILAQLHISAAFFCIGNRIAGKEKMMERLHGEGHIVGNHSHTHHFWFDLLSSGKMLTNLRLMDDALEKAIGLRPKLFRPPYGVINPNLKKAIIKGNYIPIGWSVRSLDTMAKDEKKLLEKMITSLRPGAVFLFHDTSRATLDMLPQFIRHAIQEGYAIVRLDKMLHLQAYA